MECRAGGSLWLVRSKISIIIVVTAYGPQSHGALYLNENQQSPELTVVANIWCTRPIFLISNELN